MSHIFEGTKPAEDFLDREKEKKTKSWWNQYNFVTWCFWEKHITFALVQKLLSDERCCKKRDTHACAHTGRSMHTQKYVPNPAYNIYSRISLWQAALKRFFFFINFAHMSVVSLEFFIRDPCRSCYGFRILTRVPYLHYFTFDGYLSYLTCC